MRDVDTTNALMWFHSIGLKKLGLNMLHNAMVAVAQEGNHWVVAKGAYTEFDSNYPVRHDWVNTVGFGVVWGKDVL